MLYEPAEDSFLLAEIVQKYAKGTVLDIGTGSGIQAVSAQQCKKVNTVLAVDVAQQAVNTARKKGVIARKSNLFSAIKNIEKFDTIICNPPYLPQDNGVKDNTIYGGKKGHEFIEKLIAAVSSRLHPNGQLFLLFSSLTNKKKIDEIIAQYCFEATKVAEKKLFAETLFVYRITKSKLLKLLEKRKIDALKRYTVGKRSVVWQGLLNNKKIIIKTSTEKRIKNEVYWLKKLSKKKIVPQLFFSGKNYFCCAFIEGKTIAEIMKTGTIHEKKRVIQEVLKQCRIMDEMNITKEEMHNPRKHIIIGKEIIMIDFERTKKTERPKNVTQFCQYIVRNLKQKNLRQLATSYKKTYKEETFRKIQDAI